MQQIAFALGHVMEWTFTSITGLGWLPSIGISVVLFSGIVYWLNLQRRYDRKAEKDGTMA